MKNNATPKNDAIRLVADKSTTKKIKPPKKNEIIVTAIFLSLDKGLTQPEAYKICGESCLHTTVSSIQTNYGIQIMREPSSFKNSFGGRPFFRYWIAEGKNRKLAQKVIIQMAHNRGQTIIPIFP